MAINSHAFRQRIWAASLAAVLLLPVLVACGGAPAATVPESSPAATTAPAETAAAPTTAPTAAPAATSAAVETPEHVLRVAQRATWPDTLDPQKASIANEIAVLALNYEGLTRLDQENNTVPAAAESWEYNDDATAITFSLRENLTYSDGSPLVAQDFVNAVYRTLDPRTPGDYQTSLEMIAGADAVITAADADAATLETLFQAVGVSATDERTITFQLTKPTPYFHTLASLWTLYPAKQSLVEAGGELWYQSAANQIGNGPFQISTIDQGSNMIAFSPNERYWQGRPKLDGIVYNYIDDASVALQAYRNDEVDIVQPDPNDIPTIKSDPVLSQEYVETPGSCTSSYELNLTLPPFDNKLVRQAFFMAFDRDAYVTDALRDSEVATLTWIPPGYPGHDPAEVLSYDPDRAKELLAEAGFPGGQGLPEIKVSYSSNNPANQARVEYLIQMYQRTLGVTLVPDPIEGTTLSSLRKEVETHPQMNGGGWCADYPDPQNWLSIYWHSESNFAKSFGYKNEQVDQLLDQADVETDPDTRADLYAQAQKLVLDDAPQIIRSNNKNYYLIKPHVKGIIVTPGEGWRTDVLNPTIEH